MANITTRSVANGSETDPGSVSAKGSALSHTELDSNFLLLNNKKLENTTDDFTGTLSVKGSGSSAVGEVRFHDNDDSHHVNVKSPATISTSYTLTLPAADGSTGQFLKTDGSGNLSFATATSGSGDITSVVAGAGLTDGATTGDATLNVGAGTGIAVNANDVAIDYTAVTELTSGLASTDELVLNDAGVLKRMDISVLSAYTAALTETLTNKSIDADNNTVTNLEVDNLKSGVLDTDISAVVGTDTTLASAKAIKTYVDAQIATKDNTDEITEGSSNLYFTDARAQAVSINNLSEDTSPQLGGALDVNGNKIVSTSGADIDIEPNGTGDVLLGNFKFDADQTVGASQDNFVLTYDNTAGKISLEAATGGGITASSTDTLTNKSLTAPILTGSSSSAGSILFKEDTDNGTNSVTLIGPAATADVTVTLPAATDTLVGKATTDTLTNKTLTTPVIASISNTGTLTLPTSTDTLVGRATTDTLTNKTLTSPSIAGGTITSAIDVNDDTKINFGNDSDCFVRWRNSSSKLEANIHGNLEIKATDSGASGKGNVLIRADNKIELRAGTDQDSAGDLLLTAFDDFQFRKLGFQSADSDVAPTTNGTTSVTLSRSLSSGEARALSEESLFFYDNSSFSSSSLRTMDNYILITGTSGSGSSTVITLEDAVSNLSNATHSAGRHLQVRANDAVVVVDGTRGRLDGVNFVLQNRMGNSGAQSRRIITESVEFHDGAEFLGTGHDQSDDGSERPVSYEFGTTGGKNTFDLTHYLQTAGTYNSGTTIFKARGRASENSTVASKTSPEIVEFGVNPQVPSFTKAQLDAISNPQTGEIAMCSNGATGNPCLALYGGSSWINVSGAALSTS